MIRTLLTTTAVAVLMTTGVMAQATTTAPVDNTMAPASDAAQSPALGEPVETGAPEVNSDAQNTMAPADNTMAPADNTMAPADNTMAPADNTMAPADNTMAPANNMEMGESWNMDQGYTYVDTDNLASRLIDQPVYSSAGDDAEEIGNITDLVFSEDGRITAVVIGVGGFLGIGEKSVAVPFETLEFTLAADNTERWVMPTTADALTNAPDFVWEDDVPADTNLEGGAMAPAADGTMAPAADGTMAPADTTVAPANTTVAPATN